MIRDIVINDEDQGRDYHCQVRFRCCEEIGGAPGICCDVNGVILERCVVWLDKCGMEVTLDPEHIRQWNREIERKYADAIVEQCIAHYERERFEAA